MKSTLRNGLRHALSSTGVAGTVRYIRRGISIGAGKLFPQRQLRRKRRVWEQRWKEVDFDPVWVDSSVEVPPELIEALSKLGLPPGQRILDVGCGHGWISAWISHKGHNVTGVDFAEAAIDQAKTRFPEGPNLHWQVMDFLHDTPSANDFDLLIDRGCLHRIPMPHWPKYAKQANACLKPGGDFILLYATFDHDAFAFSDMRLSRAEAEGYVIPAFSKYFEVQEVWDTGIMLCEEKSAGRSVPAVGFWMKAL